MLGIEYLRKTTGKVQTDIKNKNMVPPFKMKPSEREKKKYFCWKFLVDVEKNQPLNNRKAWKLLVLSSSAAVFKLSQLTFCL